MSSLQNHRHMVRDLTCRWAMEGVTWGATTLPWAPNVCRWPFQLLHSTETLYAA